MPEPPVPAGILGQIFGYVDKPWKLAAVVVLFVIGGGGWVAYEKRDAIIAAWLTPETHLNLAAVPKALDWLILETGADLVEVWSGDLNSNAQRFIDGRRKPGSGPVVADPRRLPILVKASDPGIIVDIIAGATACATIGDGHRAPIGKRLLDRGMRRACAVPVPPSPDAFVGVIYLAWVTAPDQGGEDIAVGAAREIASQLVGR